MQVSITVDTENTVTEDAELMSLLLPEIGIYKVGFKFGMGDMQSSVLTLDARKLERDDVSQYTVHNILDHIAVDCETIGPVCLQGNHIFVTIPCRVKAQTVTI